MPGPALPPSTVRDATRRLHAGVLLAAAVPVLALLTLVIYLLDNSREQRRDAALLTARNLVSALERGLSVDIERIDLALVSIVDQLERQAPGQRPDLDAIRSSIQAAEQHQAALNTIRVTDRTGLTLIGPNRPGEPPLKMDDREWFQWQRDQGDGTLYLYGPLRNKMAGAWILSLSRRYRDAQGAFAGSVSAPVPVAYLQRHLQDVDVGPGGLVSLRVASQRLVARNPPLPDDEVGRADRPPLGPELQAELAGQRQQGTLMVPARGQLPAFAVSWRRLSAAPLVMLVELSADDYLTEWRREALTVTTAGAALLALYAAGLALLLRTLARSRQAHERAKLLATVFERAGESIVVADGDNQILEVNPAFEQLTGYSAAEARGRDGAFLRAPRSLNTEHADMRRALQSRGRWSGEVWNRTKDGMDYPVWLSISVVRDERGQVIRHVGMATDITERKLTSDRLAVSYHALRSVSQGIIITGVDGLITEVNAAFTQITGYPAAEVVGLSCDLLTGSDTDPQMAENIRRAFAQRESFLGEILHHGKGGQTFWNELSIAPIHDEQGKLTHFIGTVRDVTERKAFEQELARHRHHLEELVTQR
ncbi:MAG: hypothetical protein RJA10_1251, partial [Pseudomonadota bacterium]